MNKVIFVACVLVGLSTSSGAIAGDREVIINTQIGGYISLGPPMPPPPQYVQQRNYSPPVVLHYSNDPSPQYIVVQPPVATAPYGASQPIVLPQQQYQYQYQPRVDEGWGRPVPVYVEQYRSHQVYRGGGNNYTYHPYHHDRRRRH